MASGWLVALALLAAYMVFIVWLVRTERLAKWNLSLMLGIVLMVRTRRGRGLIDATARPKRFWNAFGDLSTVFVMLGMVAMTAVFLWSVAFALDPKSGVERLGPSEILVIPGFNPFVPLWYGIIALIVTLVVHEGGHGVLARANAMRIKSIGLLYAIVPIGAFVEPEEEDIKTATRRRRLRVFAAGPAVNVAVALLCLGGFALMTGSLDLEPGAHVAQVTEDGPAEKAGLRFGDTILVADGEEIADWEAFGAFMDDRRPGDEVSFLLEGGKQHTVTLGSRWDTFSAEGQEEILHATSAGNNTCAYYYDDAPHGPDCAERMRGDAVVGIYPWTQETGDYLAHPFSSGAGFLQLVSLPVAEVKGYPVLSVYLLNFYDAPAWWGFWTTMKMLFWLFWINLMVGLTNILPMVPLDGGHIFRDFVGGAIERLKPNADPRRVEKAVGWASGFVSLFILGAFILQIVGPWIVR